MTSLKAKAQSTSGANASKTNTLTIGAAVGVTVFCVILIGVVFYLQSKAKLNDMMKVIPLKTAPTSSQDIDLVLANIYEDM